MSERADDDVRGEQRKAARLVKQPLQRGEDSTAMATVAERRSLPSPEVILGQAWSNWVDAVKLHGNDGAESEESFKECGKNREAMRLCRDDMPIFGQCPAQDDFYLVMCSHCSQVIKPQAFQAHYERRHGSVSKLSSSAAYSLPGFSSRGRSGGGAAAGPLGASSGGSNSAPSAKEKLPHRKSHFPLKMLHNDILTPAIKVEKIHLKMDYPSSKPAHVPASPASASSITVSSSPTKPGLNTPSVPKAQLLTLAHLPNGKGHPASLDKKQDGGSSLSSKRLYRRPLEREFNPDVHCGVLDMGARKPCTRSLTCKTHSLSQRRAVPGRSFDALLAEHRGRTRDRELQHRAEPSLQAPPLRDLPPPSSRLLPHGNSVAADSPKPSALSKPKPHNHSLPRVNSSSYGGLGDPAVAHELSQHPHTAPTPDGVGHPSSDEGEPEDREDPVEKLDCHYSGHHPRPTAYCTFGSLQLSRSWFAFDRRWNRVRCALAAMMDKHVNSLMWKKIPLVQENSSSSAVPLSQRSSANSLSSSFSSGFLSPSPPLPYGQSYESKPVLSYGTTLNARATPQRAGEQPAYGGSSNSSRQVSSSSPQMPSAHSSSLPSAQGSSKPNKSRSGTKSFRVREPSPASSNSGAEELRSELGHLREQWRLPLLALLRHSLTGSAHLCLFHLLLAPRRQPPPGPPRLSEPPAGRVVPRAGPVRPCRAHQAHERGDEQQRLHAVARPVRAPGQRAPRPRRRPPPGQQEEEELARHQQLSRGRHLHSIDGRRGRGAAPRQTQNGQVSSHQQHPWQTHATDARTTGPSQQFANTSAEGTPLTQVGRLWGCGAASRRSAGPLSTRHAAQHQAAISFSSDSHLPTILRAESALGDSVTAGCSTHRGAEGRWMHAALLVVGPTPQGGGVGWSCWRGIM
ncbi:ataxin-7 isoform X2 [Brachyhypopomus gauderio]|uniref:ataxin-7 isoform X2 n=1 Tax=Brachyhypopomus gauderio TaxID=698409 RepID=UPI0040428100